MPAIDRSAQRLATGRLLCLGLCLALLAMLAAPAPTPAAKGADTARRPAPPKVPAAPARAATRFVPLPPFADRPRPSAASVVIPVPARPWLPPAQVLGTPRALPSDGRYALVIRPAVDLPRLAFEKPPPPPARALDAGLLAHALCPDPERLAAHPGEPRADRAPADVLTDPTLGESRRSSLAVAPKLRQTAAPFVELTIPDPFEVVNAIRMRNQPPDTDPPASPSAPPAPKLPEPPPPARK